MIVVELGGCPFRRRCARPRAASRAVGGPCSSVRTPLVRVAALVHARRRDDVAAVAAHVEAVAELAGAVANLAARVPEPDVLAAGAGEHRAPSGSLAVPPLELVQRLEPARARRRRARRSRTRRRCGCRCSRSASGATTRRRRRRRCSRRRARAQFAAPCRRAAAPAGRRRRSRERRRAGRPPPSRFSLLRHRRAALRVQLIFVPNVLRTPPSSRHRIT